jgi:hypothetical protein
VDVSNPFDESASMGDDPYLAQIATALGRGEEVAANGAPSTVGDKAQRTQNAKIS